MSSTTALVTGANRGIGFEIAPQLARQGWQVVAGREVPAGQLSNVSPGVPSSCFSKLALNGVTIMLARALKPDGIAVNSVCPDWVRTDMGDPSAPRSVEEGADTAVWLATEASPEFTGMFFRDRQDIPW
jgi:NAD(P)-dependent dehydrogenase (short-subunit alcohol dehydrogenase family)